MSHFSQSEIDYMKSQRLGRLATVNDAGEPHVVPVGFRYNAELDTIDIGGHNIGRSKKFREVAKHEHVSFVIDDVLPPWKPRGIEIRGRAQTLQSGGQDFGRGFDPEIIRIYPTRIISWGIDSNAFSPSSRKV